MADQGTQNRESFMLPINVDANATPNVPVHAQPTIGMGYMYTKLLSQAGRKKFRRVDQYWRHADLPASTEDLGLWPSRKAWETQNWLFQYAFILAFLFKGVMYHAVLQQTRQESILRRIRGRLTISSIP